MDFLEKLDHLMAERNLNKSTLSKSCDIPYTTIDGWYKKGYEGLKLTTLRKLSNFFDKPLDFWVNDRPSLLSCSDSSDCPTNSLKEQILESIDTLSDDQVNAVSAFIKYLTQQTKEKE